MEISVLINEFAAHLADDPNTSPRTAEFYEADLKEFARFLAENNVVRVEDIGVGGVIGFRNHLLENQRKRFTVYRKDAAVRRFLDWVRTSTDAGLDFDPIEPMHQPLDQQITFLEDDEAAQLFSFPVNDRDAARDAPQGRLGAPASHPPPPPPRLSEGTVEAIRRYLHMRDDETPELIVG